MKPDAVVLEHRRRAAIADWRRGMIPYHIAQKHEVSHVSVLRWIHRYQRDGSRGLSSRRPTGRPPKLPAGWLSKLPAILLKGAAYFGYLSDLWTTQRVAEVIHRLTGVHYHRDHVCRLLQRLGFSWQRPERRARERDERKVQHWLQTVWPAIKKRANRSVQPSFSSTNPVSP